MKILFVQPWLAPYGVEVLSAFLKKHEHKVDSFLDPLIFSGLSFDIPSLAKYFDEKESCARKIHEFQPDIIAFSVIYDYYNWALDYSRFIKNRFNIPIVFGGIHPTTLPRQVLKNDCVDYLVIGEGEGAFIELIQALESGQKVDAILNLGFRKKGEIRVNPLRPLIDDLDSLPHPDKELFSPIWQQQHVSGYSTMASRGCPFRCSYCCHSYLRKLYKGEGKYVRNKSVEYFMEELRLAVEKYHPKEMVFHDESLPTNKQWFNKFAKEYQKQIGLPYFCWVSPESIDTQRSELLKSSGCKTVQIGVLGAPGTDKTNTSNRKQFSDKIGNAIDLMKAADIFVVADNVVGMPGHTTDEMANLIRFFVDHPPDLVFAYWLRYYPKTEIIQTALKAKILTDQDVNSIEECKNAVSFTKPQKNMDRKFKRLANLIMLCIHMPKGLVYWLLKSDSNLKWMPHISMYNLAFIMPSIRLKYLLKKSRIQLLYTPSSMAMMYLRKIFKCLADFFRKKN